MPHFPPTVSNRTLPSAGRCLLHALRVGGGLALALLSLLPTACDKGTERVESQERQKVDSLVRVATGIDSLARLQRRFEAEGNRLGSIVTLREWGKSLRNESRFDEALRVHSQGLHEAESLGDTIEWVQALNNIGTDYRRMGVLDVAQEYHYNAWKLSEESTDTTFQARKNRVVSLNGLGNIYMALGNYERADSALRRALKGEQELKSAVGQAINYANLGAIFAHRHQLDSAWAYYRHSMALNTEAGNELGISLCHTYFGMLYEQAKDYDRATLEYETAYGMMRSSKDDWHALNSLIALAGIHLTTGQTERATTHLGKALQMAERIKSPEHLADIYTLYYKLHKRQGRCSAALAAFEKATALQDSVVDLEKMNRIQNTSLNIERNRQRRQIGEARHKLEEERNTRYVGFAIFGFVMLILAAVLTIVLYTNRLRRRSHIALKHMAALRENFFTNITHEFRTPLTVILGLTHDLKRGSPTAAEVQEKVDVIERQGNGLLALINQLLDISKIKSAVGNPDWHRGNITAYLAMLVESYRDYARTRHIDLAFAADGPVEMDFVPDYVAKAMNNLLSNAFKFTPHQGKVSVAVSRKADHLTISVSDTGAGMSREIATHVFEPFYQGRDDGRNVGTGVGLALVKQIVDAIEGHITVDSRPDEGTTFCISLPIRRNASVLPSLDLLAHPLPEALLPEEQEIPSDTLSGDADACRLLIIEDNADIAAYIGAQFPQDYALAYADNGIDGMEKALQLVPDLIITDLMMPGIDGLELCRRVRDNAVLNHIPIIVVTAKISEQERIAGLQAGADAYLAKPFNSDELRTRVEKLLEGRRLLREKYRLSLDVPTSADTSTTLSDKSAEADRLFLSKVTDTIYLSLSHHRDISVATLSSAMCMSSSQLYRKLLALTDCPPATYIQQIKIKKAKHLLESDPRLTLNEVAERCGFEVYASFSRTFKNVCGISPNDFRRQQAGEAETAI